MLDCHKNQHKCVIGCLLHFTPACAELSLASSVPFSFLHCFCLLHCTGENETVTAEEVAENHRFINAICATRVMQHVHKYLVSQGKSPSSERQFKEQLYDLWFKLYRRTRGSRALDSSGFEHVFVGETRGGTYAALLTCTTQCGSGYWVVQYWLCKLH